MIPPTMLFRTNMNQKGTAPVKRSNSWSPKEREQMEKCQELAKAMSRFKLPGYCHKFYNNPVVSTLKRRKSTKEIWGNVFHPGTPEQSNRKQHYFAKSEPGNGSRFEHYYGGRDHTRESHNEGLKRTQSKRHDYDTMPNRHKGSAHI
jgi:hypothetical protein